MKTKPALKLLAATLLSTLSAHLSPAFAQGSLIPPGAPAPTMKSLNQIEPRIPISSLPAAINVSGSYYLTTNLTGTSGQNGISVNVGDVTINLNGFALIGVPGSHSGIGIGLVNNITIQDGTLRNWDAAGVSAPNSANVRLVRLTAVNNGGGGFFTGDSSQVVGCLALTNGASGIAVGDVSSVSGCNSRSNALSGIFAGSDGSVTGSQASGNGAVGIHCGDNATINGCGASDNRSGGISTGKNCAVHNTSASGNTGTGIVVADGSVITGCPVSANTGSGIASGISATVNHCSVSYNGAAGIAAGDGSTVSDCAAYFSHGVGISAGTSCLISSCSVFFGDNDGIVVITGCKVLNNTSDQNGLGSANAGIRCAGFKNSLEGNHAFGNYNKGIDCGTSTPNLIIKNSASTNPGGNYINTAGNDVGPIGSAAASTSPWANISF